LHACRSTLEDPTKKSVPPAQPVACVALIRALLLAPLKGVLRIQSLILECYQFA
jgi:hypothetical protein